MRFTNDDSRVGGPGVVVGRGQIRLGPFALSVALGLVTAAAAVGQFPWWGCLLIGLFWPAFSIAGQLWL